jgi:cysteine desulfurase/selenocysteine lyase
MTTNMSTSSPEWPPSALPDPAALTKLANELFAALPGTGPAISAVGGGAPTETSLRTFPAAGAGATGLSPQPLVAAPAPDSADPFYYLFESARPTSPHTLPALNLAPPGLDSALGFTVPATATAADPRSAPGRSAPLGQRFGSTVPATPVIELGAQPFVPAAPPASAFGAPTEESLRGAPAAGAGAAKVSPQPLVTPAAPGTTGSPYYFLDSVPSNPPRTVPAAPGEADFYPPPTPRTVETGGSPLTPTPEAAGGSLYFLDELRALTATPRGPDDKAALARPEATTGLGSAHPAFDAYAVRRDFPILQERVHGRPLIWLDNAATTQKPQAVIDRLSSFYQHENSNIHRAAHELAARATDAYEAARDKVARFLHAASSEEIVFVRGTTEAINLVAQAWGRRNIGKDDEIVITWLEHHANIVPWQQLCAETGARLRVAPVDDCGQSPARRVREAARAPGPGWSSFSQVSNALGTSHPRPGDGRDRPSLRRAGAPGRRAGRPASAGRRARPSTATGMCSPAIRCLDRPASARCTASWTCSTLRPPGKAAAT